ncbi:MAG TPA: glycoside hydrolase family 43 protein [Verrucomicrobiae bacterium]|nr:glycoside hydrolase family 43 protein [Verrucomicrobiae bacterium]
MRLIILFFALFPGLIPLVARAAGTGTGRTFTNPVVERGQDPWVIWWHTNYYLCQSRSNGVWVNRAARLEEIGRDHWTRVWQPAPGTAHSQQVWAPELHFLDGKWYLYVAADGGDNAGHRLYVLEGTSTDPQKPFVFKGKIASPSDRWAIDGTVLRMPDGKLYFIWAGWPGAADGVQNLYLAPMSNPWTICGRRVCISRPDRKWERRDDPKINEGPEALWHNGRLFIIYSASAFWDDNYCLGQLTWTGGDVLDPGSWVKKSEPVFQRTADVLGPGHCCFVKSPDGKEDWIVYHAHIGPNIRARDIRIQRFTWNADGSPDFGAPVDPGVPLAVPSGEQ